MAAPEPPDPAELERALLGGSRRMTSEDVATEAGVELEDARRLWRALGFPEVGDLAAFGDADLAALGTIGRTVAEGTLDFETAVRLTRAVGQTMARLADWQVATLTGRVEQSPAADAPAGSRRGSVLRLAEEIGEPFERLLHYAWRRHLAVAIGRVEAFGATDDDLHTVEVTVGFADLIGFTALSNQMDEDRIGDLVEVFESRCADVVAGQRGRVIKTLGDSVLFVADDPVRGMDIALSIVQLIGRDPRLPDVKLGVSTGSVVMRLGDVFGPPVNMAARLTAVARRNRVITDPATAALLPVADFETQPLPPRPLRGFGVVEPVAVRRP